MKPNQATLLTASGAAAIAVVRVSGPGVVPFLQRCFSKQPAINRCVHGELRSDDGRVFDDSVVILHPSRATADINLHGGPWVVQSCLDLLRRSGFEIISNSSELAVIEGQTVLEREMLAHLLLAMTEESLRALLAQPQAWQQFIESHPNADAIQTRLADRALWWMLNPPCIAIVGAANVGKSTLANQLFGQPHSITADAPGTTRDWVGELANIDGMSVMLLDTPGVRQSGDDIEQRAIQRAGLEVLRADLVICVLDVTQPLDVQAPLLEKYPDALWLANKCDLTPVWPIDAVADALISAKHGRGLDELRGWITSRFDWCNQDLEKPRWWTVRQRELLEQSVKSPTNLRQLLD